MKHKKGQAAMEFLMTYGWAILAAIIAIGVLAYFGVFTPDRFVYEEFTIYKEECSEEINKEKLIEQGILLDEMIEVTFKINQVIFKSAYYNEEIDNKKLKSLIDKNKLLRTKYRIINVYDKICEKVEVDEILIKKEVKECIKDVSGVIEECEGEWFASDYRRCIESYDYGYTCSSECESKTETEEASCKNYKTFKITKIDLKREWLNENCEGAVVCDLDKENCKYQEGVESSKYKCNDYIVNVKGGY